MILGNVASAQPKTTPKYTHLDLSQAKSLPTHVDSLDSRPNYLDTWLVQNSSRPSFFFSGFAHLGHYQEGLLPPSSCLVLRRPSERRRWRWRSSRSLRRSSTRWSSQQRRSSRTKRWSQLQCLWRRGAGSLGSGLAFLVGFEVRMVG